MVTDERDNLRNVVNELRKSKSGESGNQEATGTGTLLQVVVVLVVVAGFFFLFNLFIFTLFYYSFYIPSPTYDFGYFISLIIYLHCRRLNHLLQKKRAILKSWRLV